MKPSIRPPTIAARVTLRQEIGLTFSLILVGTLVIRPGSFSIPESFGAAELKLLDDPLIYFQIRKKEIAIFKNFLESIHTIFISCLFTSRKRILNNPVGFECIKEE
jgi:hypothetical protein